MPLFSFLKNLFSGAPAKASAPASGAPSPAPEPPSAAPSPAGARADRADHVGDGVRTRE